MIDRSSEPGSVHWAPAKSTPSPSQQDLRQTLSHSRAHQSGLGRLHSHDQKPKTALKLDQNDFQTGV
ncbi:MAG TPA: hypothetical protein DCE20_06445 [Gammaproteobacteria bacterium]|nr:hypothetical protein [Gammaproteobacteria bacterium]